MDEYVYQEVRCGKVVIGCNNTRCGDCKDRCIMFDDSMEMVKEHVEKNKNTKK